MLPGRGLQRELFVQGIGDVDPEVDVDIEHVSIEAHVLDLNILKVLQVLLNEVVQVVVVQEVVVRSVEGIDLRGCLEEARIDTNLRCMTIDLLQVVREEASAATSRVWQDLTRLGFVGRRYDWMLLGELHSAIKNRQVLVEEGIVAFLS